MTILVPAHIIAVKPGVRVRLDLNLGVGVFVQKDFELYGVNFGNTEDESLSEEKMLQVKQLLDDHYADNDHNCMVEINETEDEEDVFAVKLLLGQNGDTLNRIMIINGIGTRVDTEPLEG